MSSVRDDSDSTKTKVPKLPIATGEDSDWFGWFDSVKNALGQYGLSQFVESAEATESQPSVASQVFYGLKRALATSKVSYFADRMEEQNIKCPYTLISSLRKHFDTSLTKSNILLTELQVLLQLRLDADTDPNSFIKEYKDSLLRLGKSDSPSASDKDLHRALLLIAIQDESYDTVRDEILKYPDKDVHDYLDEIRKRFLSLGLKDGKQSIRGDGVVTRRTGVPHGRSSGKSSPAHSGGSNQHRKSSGKPFGNTSSFARFPPQWRNIFGSQIMDVLYHWRNLAVQNKDQDTINRECRLEVESPPSSRSRSRSNTKSRRTASGSSKRKRDDSDADSVASGGSDDGAAESSSSPKMAVTLTRVSKKGRRTTISSPLFSEEETRRGRRVRIRGGVAVADHDQATFVVDSGCDQCLLAGTVFRVLQDTGRSVFMTQAFAGRGKGEHFPVVQAAAKLVLPDGRKFKIVVNEGLFDSNPLQLESLLAPHQVLEMDGYMIDDRTPEETRIDGQPGSLCCVFDGEHLPLYHDGAACFFALERLSDSELESLPCLELTRGDAGYVFDPKKRVHSRRLPSIKRTLDDWRECLAFAPPHVVEKTLEATTQLVPSVEAETREIMRDHFKSRLPSLRHKRIRDKCYLDTFFSSVVSVRGYKCWNLYSFERTGMDVPYLMRLRSQAPSTAEDLFRDYAIPELLHSDNAPEFKGKRFTKVMRQHLVQTKFSEPHHPNQNLAEPRGGQLKAAVVRLLQVTKAPLEFWCYALEYVALVRQHLARRSLSWKTPHECFFQHTPDLSMFRIPWWCPIWYYAPKRAFPEARMLPGRMVGIAWDQGDAFCYLIVTEDGSGSIQVLSRSVVRRRDVDSDEEPPFVSSLKDGSLVFYKSDGKTVLEDHCAGSEELESVDPLSDAIPPVADSDSTMDHPIFSRAPTSLETDDLLFDAIEGVNRPRKRPRLSVETPAATSDSTKKSAAATTTAADASDSVSQATAPAAASATTTPPLFKKRSHRLPKVTTVTQEDDDLDSDEEWDDGLMDFDDDDNDIATNDTVERPAARSLTPDSPPRLDPDPDIQMEISRHLETLAEDDDDDMFESVVGHESDRGVLKLHLRYTTGEVTTVPFSLCKRDYPYAVSQYILEKKIGSADGRYKTGRFLRWARLFQRQCNRVVRRVARREAQFQQELTIDDFDRPLNLPENIVRCRRTKPGAPPTRSGGRKRTKPGRNRRIPTVKYGAKVPTSIAECKAFDEENGNNRWMEAIKKEISSLLSLNCFEFLELGSKPSPEYKFVHLHMVYDVKSCGRFKARLVANGAVVSPDSVNAYSSVVKGISVRLLDLIAQRDGLTTLCGDIGNAFVTAPAAEKVWTRLGPEFGDREGTLAIICKALYGLRSSSRAFRAHFAEYLRSFGFRATRYDRDVWMRLRDDESGYDYICTHVDDFKIVARDPQQWMTKIKAIFLVKSEGPPSYYLGNDYCWSEEEQAWVLSCGTYVKECIRRIEALFGTLSGHDTALPAGIHPELDDSELLDATGTRQFQMLIGMAQWANLIGRLDLGFAIASLSRFSANPRKRHLELALHIFGYLKRNKGRRILLTAEPLSIDHSLVKEFNPDFTSEYPDATEELDPALPKPLGKELETSIFFDADHAHDVTTRRSITGLIVMVGSTPVHWVSRRQGCIATSTYCSEFMAMRSAVEEAMALRYMLRCLGVPVTEPTNMFGDNMGSILSAASENADLKKKHVALSFHFVRESVAANIVKPIWLRSEHNFADLMTKALGRISFRRLVDNLTF